MSKQEATETKSLEEILASIRKSLSEETGERPPEPRVAPGKTARPSSAPATGGGFLSNKLAGALNGSAGGLPLDADLNALLASEPKKPVPSAPADVPTGAGANGGDEKDPLWFLSRLSSAAAGSAPQGSAARARDAAKAPAAEAPAEEVKLSLPETLRPSLPPLFDANTKQSPGNRARAQTSPVDFAGTTLRTQPRVLPPQAVGVPEGQVKPEASAAASPVAADAVNEAEVAASEASSQPSAVIEPAFNAKLEPAPTPLGEPAVAGTIDLGSDSAPQGAPASAGAIPEARPLATDGLQTRPLEQMVAEMLEPVIRQWLQGNLPRLIESTVREEVARAVAAEREAKKV